MPSWSVLCVQNYLTLLDDEDHTLEGLKIQDEQHLVIEGSSKVPIQLHLCIHVISKNCKCEGVKLHIRNMARFLLSVRNKDMSWPEEMSFIANSSKMDRHKGKL